MAQRRAIPNHAIPDRAIPDHTILGRPVGEAAVDGVQHLLDRAEGHVEIDWGPVLARSLHPLAETFADPAEHHGIGALEAEDRLLDVADGEHGARRAGQTVFGRRALDAGAGEKLPRDRLDQAPLLRAGILRLVDQDMVDAAVHLVEHPFRRRLAGQQVLCHQDQIVEIENGAPALLRLVPLVDRRAEPGQCRAALRNAQRLLAVEKVGEPPRFPVQDFAKVGQFPDRRLCRQSGSRASVGFQEYSGVIVEQGRPCFFSGGQPFGNLRRLPNIRLAAGFQRPGRPIEFLAVEPPFGAGLGIERRLACAGVEAGGVVQAADGSRNRSFVLQQIAQPAALAEEFAEQCGQVVRPAERCEQRQFFGIRAAAGLGIGQNPVAHAVQQGALVALLDDPEVGRHAGLQREALEQGLAEGVDRLDAHTARHVQAGREQGAGARPFTRLREAADDFPQVFAQRLAVHQRPSAEPGGDPVGHLRRRGLGEGEAQDARRGGAVEQQPQDAPGQHMGLARAGAGADPGGDIRFRRPALGERGGPSGIGRRAGATAGAAGAGHDAASASAHSRMRARCS